jgi:hypothetical protein
MAVSTDYVHQLIWELKLSRWAQGPGKVEAARCLNAQRVVSECLRDGGLLERYNAEVFVQGSYANRTNIPTESDVDICVVSRNPFIATYPFGLTQQHYGHLPSAVLFSTYRADVERALKARFKAEVQRGNKCFSIRSNTFRVDADVTASFQYREYRFKESATYDAFGTLGGSFGWRAPLISDTEDTDYDAGCRFYSDFGEEITNWPQQHIRNGIIRNSETAKRYKRLVRIMKRIQVEATSTGKLASKLLPSYAIECAVYNVSASSLTATTYYEAVRSTLLEIYQAATKPGFALHWVEANGRKRLFDSRQPWSQPTFATFASAAWNLIGFQQFTKA